MGKNAWQVARATALAIAVGACGGAEGRLEPRFVAVHNALTAMGMAQTGSINEGSLPEGADARVVTRLEAGECYTFVAFGSDGVRDVDLRVLDEGGEEVARDVTHDRQAAAQVCADRSGDYQAVVTMTRGQGGYVLSAWSGGARGGGGLARGGGGGRGGRGTCDQPVALELGRPVRGTTAGGGASLQGSCVQGEAPEQVYRLQIARRAQVSIRLQSSFDAGVYVLSNCGQGQQELACNDDAGDTSHSSLDLTLDEGTYFLVVDGYGSESGDYEMIVSESELQPLSAVCGDAPPLVPGQPASGSTQGSADYFQALCAGGAHSPDRVYRLDVTSRSRVRLRQQSDHDGALHVRRNCTEPTTEVACNDDHGDQRTSLITTLLESGTYYVISDGYAQGNSGNFTLTADVAPDTGGGATADGCGDAGTATVGQQIDVDTFQARDDTQGSCGGQGSPDVVYRVDVRGRSRLRATVNNSEFAGAVYVQRACGNATTEVACTAVQAGAAATVDTAVQSGTYYVVVDGERAETFGTAQLQIQIDDVAATERACRQAPMLRAGQRVTGNTASGSDQFQASCAGGAQSNDIVYRLRVQRRSLVRVNMQSDYDGALHLRRDCVDPSSELVCNDDHEDNRHSRIEATLDPGTYYVVVDGFRSGNTGGFTIDVETSAP